MSKTIVINASKKQHFNESEKRRIVQDSYASTLSLSQFARSVGVSPASLCQWRKIFKRDCTKEMNLPATYAQAPLVDLRQECETLRQENLGLKEELYKMQAYMGRKLYEVDAKRLQDIRSQ